MNNIPNAGSANNMGSAQRAANAPPAQGRAAAVNGDGQQRPAAAAAAEIGTQAVRQGVRFNNNDHHGHVQEQIRTYVPSSPVTEGVEEGDRQGSLMALLRELTAVNSSIPPPLETRRTAPPRWESSLTSPQSDRSGDSAPEQPTRSADSKLVDTAPSLPKRSSD